MVKHRPKDILTGRKVHPMKKSDMAMVLTKPQVPKIVSAEKLPLQAVALYGCSNCDWRGTSMCPYGYKKGRGAALKDNSRITGICEDRENYLLNISGLDTPRPSFSTWSLEFHKGMAKLESAADYSKLQEIRENLDLAKDKLDPNSRTVKELKKEEEKARERFHKLVIDIIKFDEAQVARETAKPVINVENMSLFQMNQLINSSVVEDQKLIEDLKEKDEKDDSAQDKQ